MRKIKQSNKATTKLDQMVGQNIRAGRLAKGLTQTELGEQLGVTFQQIQKYEKGYNRVGSGRLHQIAEVLEMPVTAFFGEEAPTASAGSSPFHLLADQLSLRLVREFAKIGNRELRWALLRLVEHMASGKG